jgi:CHAT domain-containing protein/Tfp pilus assembly protein PilF
MLSNFAARLNALTRRAVFVLAAALLLAVSSRLAAAQEALWNQLTQRVAQLRQQGKSAEATPLAQQAVNVAQSTYGAQDPHLGLSLNMLGLLDEDQEKFSDAEALYQRALSIFISTQGQQSANVASILNNLANLYRVQSRYADAEKLFVQALSIHEKVLGANDPTVAADANNLALCYATEGKYTDAEPLYERAIAIDEKQNQPDSSVTKEMINLADLYQKEGKDNDAEQLFLKALALDLKTYGNEHPTIANDLNLLSGAYMDEGKYSVAEPIILRAMAIDQKVSSPDSAAIATDLGNLAVLYRNEGRYAEAEPLFQRAISNRISALGPDHPEVASLLDNFAQLYADEGKYPDAETLYRRAIDIRVKKFGTLNPLVALSLGNLAELYKQQGRYAEAETMYRNAMTIDLKTLGQQNPAVAVVLNNTANLFLEEGRLADAEKLLRGALAINQNAYGANNAALAPNLNLLAEVSEYEGKHADAEALYQQALSLAEKSLGLNHPDVAADLIGLAAVYEDGGNYAQAEPLFLRALTIYQNAFGPDHPSTGEAEMNLAVLYYGWSKPQQAEPYFDRRIGNLMDQFRSNAAYMSEKDRLNFLGTVPGAFPLFYSFALKYHDSDPALAGKVYDDLLQQKGFIAANAAALRAKILASGDKQTLALLDKLTAEKTQLAVLASSTQGDSADRRKQIAQLAQEANQLEQEIVKRSSAFGQEKTLSTVTWRDVQKALKPGEAAVEYTRFQFHNGKSFTSTVYYVALVVTPASKEPDFIVLGEAKDLESGPIAGYRANVGQMRGLAAEAAPGDNSTTAAPVDTSAAYAAFWEPLEPALANATRIYVSPDGVLNQIPMGLLADSNGKLLMEKYQLRTVNSTKDILRPQAAATLKTAVLLGNPKFDLTEAEQRAALAELKIPAASSSIIATANAAALSSASRSSGAAALPPLPGTQVEVTVVNKLLNRAGWQATPYTGDVALKAVVNRVRNPRIMHIATHGFFLSDQDLAQKSQSPGGQHAAMQDPMFRSGLFFAGANRTESGAAPAAGLDDGVLTAYEASQLDLEGTDLVVLSACETGLGEQSNGEGVFGLRRGLQEAGAGAVLMSMWSVPDLETQELMAGFYAKWLGGLDKPEALRQAQLQEREVVRQRYGKDLPYYWGAFVLVSP